MSNNLIEDIKRLYSYHLEKYESACVFREFDKAISHHGAMMGLEHILLQYKESEWLFNLQKEAEDRRNKIVALWRELTT